MAANISIIPFWYLAFKAATQHRERKRGMIDRQALESETATREVKLRSNGANVY